MLHGRNVDVQSFGKFAGRDFAARHRCAQELEVALVELESEPAQLLNRFISVVGCLVQKDLEAVAEDTEDGFKLGDENVIFPEPVVDG